MDIPNEIIESGVLETDGENDIEQMFLVESYNTRMNRYRLKFTHVISLGRVILILDFMLPIIISMIPMIPPTPIFLIKPRIEWLEWTALGVFALGYVIFGLWKRNFIVLTLLSALLILADLRCGFVFVLNVPLTVIYETNYRKVKHLDGFPLFRNIRLKSKSESTTEKSAVPADTVKSDVTAQHTETADDPEKNRKKAPPLSTMNGNNLSPCRSQCH